MKKSLNLYDNMWDFMDVQGDLPAINIENFPIAFFSLISLFAEDADFNLEECYVDRGCLFISGCCNGERNELMLRYKYYNALVVARVHFIHKRKGKMTELYRILNLIRRKYNTGPIVIESASTNEMVAWCKKQGFIGVEPSPAFSEIGIRTKTYIQPK